MTDIIYSKCSFCNDLFFSKDAETHHLESTDCLSNFINQQLYPSNRNSVPANSPSDMPIDEDNSTSNIFGWTAGMDSGNSYEDTYGAEDYGGSDVEMEETSAYEAQPSPSVYNHCDSDYEWNTIQQFGIGLLSLFESGGVARETQREIIRHINNNLLPHFNVDVVSSLGGKVPSPDTLHRLLDKGSRDIITMHDVCRNGCILFDNSKAHPIKCTNTLCSMPRYKNDSLVEEYINAGMDLDSDEVQMPAVYQQMAITSVGSSLAELLVDDDIRKLFEEQAELNDSIVNDSSSDYTDIFSGSTYRSFRNDGIIGRNDICLVVYVDGFVNKHKPKSSQTLVHCLIMNIPSSLRYQEAMMLPLGIIPGPNKPKDLMSFLRPVIEEVTELSNKGFIVQKNGIPVHESKVFLLGITGDIPGIGDLMNHRHTSYHGCRYCRVRGGRPEGTSNGMYFKNSGAIRTTDELVNGNDAFDMPGIPRLISSIKTFTKTTFYLGDEMHCISRGIGALVYNLLNPRTNVKFKHINIGTDTSIHSYTFELHHSSPDIMSNLGKLVDKSCVNIPPAFEGSWDGILGINRAVDYLDFLLYIVPTIIVPLLVSSPAKVALMDLINGCLIALQWDISRDDLTTMNICFSDWHKFLNEEIVEKRLNERVFTVNNHYLSHMSLLIEEMGPLRSFSCRSMERTIKKYTNLIKSTSKTGVNASNVLRWQANLNKTAVRQLLATLFPPKADKDSVFQVSPCKSLEVWGVPYTISLDDASSTMEICGGTTRSKLYSGLTRYYTRKTGSSISSTECKEIDVFARAWTDDNVVYSSVINRQKKGSTTRADNVVLFDVVVKSGRTTKLVWCVGTVLCFFTHIYNGEKNYLAAIDPMLDQTLDSHNVPVVSRRPATSSPTRTAVISISDIVTVVGLVEYSATPNKFKAVHTYIKYQEKFNNKKPGKLSQL